MQADAGVTLYEVLDYKSSSEDQQQHKAGRQCEIQTNHTMRPATKRELADKAEKPKKVPKLADQAEKPQPVMNEKQLERLQKHITGMEYLLDSAAATEKLVEGFPDIPRIIRENFFLKKTELAAHVAVLHLAYTAKTGKIGELIGGSKPLSENYGQAVERVQSQAEGLMACGIVSTV